jgi:hypothetical protein
MAKIVASRITIRPHCGRHGIVSAVMVTLTSRRGELNYVNLSSSLEKTHIASLLMPQRSLAKMMHGDQKDSRRG